jgi:penicillin-binding protein-related factor A (putative recombinase)
VEKILINEKSIEKLLKKECKNKRIFCRKLNTDSPGMPDMILIRNRQTLLVELKYLKKDTDIPSKYFTKSQFPFYREILKFFGILYVIFYVKENNWFYLYLIDSVGKLLNLNKKICDMKGFSAVTERFDLMINMIEAIEFGSGDYE